MNEIVIRYSVLVACSILTLVACVLLFRRRRGVATGLLLGGSLLGLFICLEQAGTQFQYIPVLPQGSLRAAFVWTSMIAVAASAVGLLLYALGTTEEGRTNRETV